MADISDYMTYIYLGVFLGICAVSVGLRMYYQKKKEKHEAKQMKYKRKLEYLQGLDTSSMSEEELVAHNNKIAKAEYKVNKEGDKVDAWKQKYQKAGGK